jgi:hypothetical protein
MPLQSFGEEFRVNTYTDGPQDEPNVVSLHDGGFVVTWESWGQDGDGKGIYGQVYDAAGIPRGNEFRVNTYTQDDQQAPSIVSLSDGGFVVTWSSTGQDGDGGGVYGQVYDAAGHPQGSEFQVNTHTQGGQGAPSVASLNDGGFVITWSSNHQNLQRSSIYGQLYDATGIPQGNEFQVNTYFLGNQYRPSVASLNDGSFVVTWKSTNGSGWLSGSYPTVDPQDGSSAGVYGQLFKVDPRVRVVKLSDASEPNSNGVFRIELEHPAPYDFDLAYEIGGSAVAGNDYEISSPEVLRFRQGDTHIDVEIIVRDDSVTESDETVTLTLLGSDSQQFYLNPDATSASLTIADDDIVPVASVVASNPLAEGAAPGEFTIQLDNPALIGGVTVNYEIVGSSTATAGADYTAPSGSLFIPEGQTSGKVKIAVQDDGLYDPNETLRIRLLGPANGQRYEVSSQNTVNFNIADNDHLYQVSLSPAGDASEAGTAGFFKVTLDEAAPTGGMRFTYSLSGTAVVDADYAPLAGEVVVLEGETEAFIRVQGLDNQVTEGNRSLTLTLDESRVISEGLNYQVNGSTSATINITDNDTASVIVTPLSTITSEAGNTAEVEVRLTSRPTEAVTVTLASSNTAEGTLDAPSVTFQPDEWNTAKVLTVRGVDDGDVPDGSQPYGVTTTVTSADANYDGFTVTPLNFTNLDNDGFDVLVSTPARVGEGDTITYTVGLTKAPTETIPVEITAQIQTEISLDGVTFSDTLTVDLSDTSLQTITVRALDDTTVEGIHTGAITHRILTHGDSNYPTNREVTPAVITIVDNDSPILNIVQVDPASEESGISGRFALALDQPAPAGGILVNYTVSVTSTAIEEGQANPDFYQLPRSVFIEGGSTGTDVIVLPVQNSISEAPESVVIDLTVGDGYVLGNDASADLTIYDDDIPGMRIRETGNTSRLFEGVAGDQYTVELTSQPTENVVIEVLAGGEVSPSQTQLTFTPGNWNKPQTVQLSLPNNDYAEGDFSETLTHTVTSTDSAYQNLSVNDVTVQVIDDDAPGIRLTESGISTAVLEGGSGDTYTIVLESAPLAPVTVALSTDEGVTLSTSSLTFTDNNWNQPQTVTVNAVNNDIDEGGRTVLISHTVSSADANYNGFELADVTVAITEDDQAGIYISESDWESRVQEDSFGDTFTVELGSQPTADVTFSFTTDSDIAPIADVTITPDQWDTIRTVQFFAATDALSEPEIEASEIQISVHSDDPNYNNVTLDSIAVEVLDREINAEETADGLGQALDQIDAFIAAELTALNLPLIPLDEVMPDFIGTFRDYLVNEIRSGGNASAEAVSQTIQSALQTSFDNAGVDVAIGVDFGITLDEMTFDITIGNTYAYNADVSADLGIPALGLNVNGQANTTFDYELGLGLGFHEVHGFYVNTDTTSFNANIGVGLSDNFSAVGNLGLLRLRADNNADDPTAATVEFSLGLNDLDNVAGPDDGNRLTGTELSSNFETSALFTPYLDGNVNIGLQANTSIAGSAALPSFLFDLDVDWDAFGYEAGEFAGLSKPTVAFNNLQIDAGSFVSDFARPIVTRVNQILAPIRPVLDFLNKDISAFKEIGFEEQSLIEFADRIASGTVNVQPIIQAIETADAISQLVEDLSETPGNFMIDLGSYTVLSPDSPEGAELSTAAVETTQSAAAPEEQVSGKLQQLLDTLKNDPTWGFPILTDPMAAIGLLLGERDVTLFTFDPPAMGIDVSVNKDIDLLGIVEADFKGHLKAGADFAFGFDTYGLYEWSDADFAMSEVYKVFDGFYVSDRANADGTGADVDELYLDAGLKVSGGVDVGIANATAKGAISGKAGINLTDPNNDGKIRASELLDLIENDGLNLFSAHGSISAHGSAKLRTPKIKTPFGTIPAQIIAEDDFGPVKLLSLEYSDGRVSIASAFDGPIAGATVFFDANRNGLLDDTEPMTFTGLDGNYELFIPYDRYDLNGNGEIELSEGRIIVEDGVDTDVFQPQRFAFSTAAHWSVASPLTTLTLEIAGDADDTTAAEAKLKQALDLPDIDITSFNPLTAMAAGDPLGLQVYAEQVQINATLTQMADLLAGAGIGDADALVIEAMTQAISQGQALNDLGNPATIALLIGMADSTLSTAVVEAASKLIAESNAEMDALAELGTTDPAYLQTLREQIAGIQNIAQGSQAERLQDLTSGELTLTQFETAIDHRILSTGFVTEYDDKETPLFVVQRMGWLEGDSAVTFSLGGEGTYGVDYSNRPVVN